jgi:hypothetical protein
MGLEGDPVVRQRRAEPFTAEAVEQLAVFLHPAEPPLICLTVNGDERLGELAE